MCKCPLCGWNPYDEYYISTNEYYSIKIEGTKRKYPRVVNYQDMSDGEIPSGSGAWEEIHYCPHCEKEFWFVNCNY